jgi:Ca2+-binding EF-hand superfamily protein
MSTAMSQIGISTTTETINYLFKLCDNDGDDKITCPELERLYHEMIKES